MGSRLIITVLALSVGCCICWPVSQSGEGSDEHGQKSDFEGNNTIFSGSRVTPKAAKEQMPADKSSQGSDGNDPMAYYWLMRYIDGLIIAGVLAIILCVILPIMSCVLKYFRVKNYETTPPSSINSSGKNIQLTDIKITETDLS